MQNTCISATLVYMQTSEHREIEGSTGASGGRTGDPVAATLSASEALVGVISRSVSDILDVVTLAQYRAMVALAPAPLLRTELASRLGGDAVRVGPILRALLDEGWVDEKENGTLALTAHGLQLVAHVEARRSAELAHILDALPPADRRAVSTGFTIFATAADGRDERRGDQPR